MLTRRMGAFCLIYCLAFAWGLDAQTSVIGNGEIRISQSGVGYMYSDGHFGGLNGLAAAGAAVVSSGDQVRCIQFAIPGNTSVSINKITIQVTTLQNPSTVTVGIYDSAKNKLWDSGTFDGSTTGAKTNTLSPAQMLGPGVYWLAWSASGTTVAVASFNATTNMAGLLNSGAVVRVGTAANNEASGVLPASLGTVTSAAVVVPQILFEP